MATHQATQLTRQQRINLIRNTHKVRVSRREREALRTARAARAASNTWGTPLELLDIVPIPDRFNYPLVAPLPAVFAFLAGAGLAQR